MSTNIEIRQRRGSGASLAPIFDECLPGKMSRIPRQVGTLDLDAGQNSIKLRQLLVSHRHFRIDELIDYYGTVKQSVCQGGLGPGQPIRIG